MSKGSSLGTNLNPYLVICLQKHFWCFVRGFFQLVIIVNDVKLFVLYELRIILAYIKKLIFTKKDRTDTFTCKC